MTGNKTIDTVLVGLATLATAAAFGVFIYTQMFYEKPLPSEKLEKEQLMAEVQKKAFSNAFKLDPLIINLHSRKTRLRFLEVTIYLLPFKEDVNQLLDENKPLINDAIIDLAGHMNPEELNSVAGKILFEDRIKKRINKFLGRPVIKEIYFAKFVVQ